jgi:hypothetical protein
MDACELSEFITPCERTPGAPEKPIGTPYVRLGVKSRRFASILNRCPLKANDPPLRHFEARDQRDDGRCSETWPLVDCRRVGEHQLFEFAKAVSNFAAIEVDAELIGM